MSSTLKDPVHLLEMEDDPRWQLVQRIIVSPSFAKTERLSSFLTCVCQLAQTGQFHNINEQYLGAAVFGRSPDYDPGVDSIVRSHASRLRHRLQQYFTQEGAGEELVLTIPKGGYVPLFESRRAHPDVHAAVPPIMDPHWEPVVPDVRVVVEPASPAAPVSSVAGNRAVVALSAALLITMLLSATAIGYLLLQRSHAKPPAAGASESVRLFWGELFNAHENTVVVNADSGLVMLQNLTKKRITLENYLSGDYLKGVPASVFSANQSLNIGTRRYTSIVDLTIVSRLFRIPGANLERAQFRYARDLRMGEIKQGNLVLLGTYESTPWVQLFEPSMNFYFRNDLSSGHFAVYNRNPKPGEQETYVVTANDPEHTVYGVVAYRPSLSGSDKVLILEGQSMAGTETASDFVFDDGYLLPFLRSIRRPDGTIPFFELLLRSKSISAEASRLEIVAYRTEGSSGH
jgi:hypothetical protein